MTISFSQKHILRSCLGALLALSSVVGLAAEPATLRDRVQARMAARAEGAAPPSRLQSSATPTPAAGYDPLVALPGATPAPMDLAVNDAQRRREIPIRIYLPATTLPAPVILYSHGLGGSLDTGAFMGRQWAARGYVAVLLQHPGSDTSAWEGKAPEDRIRSLKSAADIQNFMLRVKDVPAVIDQLEKWNAAPGNELQNRMDLGRLGMCGHSFGAVTTQAVSGQSFPTAGTSLTDPRIKAAIAFSPSSPASGRDPKLAFSSVKIPWMLMTGTKDSVALFSSQTAESRLLVYPALPSGGKYELVLNNAEHSVFTDRPLPGDKEPRNPKHHAAILALSTAFWDANLRGDAAAKTWLDGTGPRTVLDKEDRWQRK